MIYSTLFKKDIIKKDEAQKEIGEVLGVTIKLSSSNINKGHPLLTLQHCS